MTIESARPSRRRLLTHGAAGLALACAPNTLAMAQAPDRLKPGQDSFWVPGGPGRERRRIQVSYFMPGRFTPGSPILLVLPGGSRNADKHLEAWIGPARRNNVLVAALGYPADDYNYAAYQLGGVVRDLRIRNTMVWPDDEEDSLSDAPIRREEITFEPQPRSAWVFSDFDRIFGMIARAAGSRRETYDLYGHSAGAQLAHRLALFRPNSGAARIVAANAGVYTLPKLDEPLIFGLDGSGLTAADLRASFATRLTVLLGDADRKRRFEGRAQRSNEAELQGPDRFTRGQTFFDAAREEARRLHAPFRWSLRVAPGVGHDRDRMARAAARILYG